MNYFDSIRVILKYNMCFLKQVGSLSSKVWGFLYILGPSGNLVLFRIFPSFLRNLVKHTLVFAYKNLL